MYLKLGSRLTFFCHFPSFSSELSLCAWNWFLGWHLPVIFPHFLQKYSCVPKIAFSADISIDIFIDISIDIFIDTLIDILIDTLIDIFFDMSIDIYIDIFIDISIDIFIGICIDILIGKEEGRGGKEGVDLLKI